MNEIQMLALAFDYYQPVSLEEARELLVYAVDEFVAAINADEKIRPYLGNYPFQPKNVEIRLFIHNRDGHNVKPGDLYVVTAVNGQLNYKIDDKPYLKTIHKESYEAAVAELAKSRQKSA